MSCGEKGSISVEEDSSERKDGRQRSTIYFVWLPEIATVRLACTCSKEACCILQVCVSSVERVIEKLVREVHLQSTMKMPLGSLTSKEHLVDGLTCIAAL